MPTHDTTIAPVVKSITIDRDIEETFRLFTEEINAWWPLETHSVSEDPSATVRLEGFSGGRLVETSGDGEEFELGVVQTWEPPGELSFSWYPGRHPDTSQMVVVRFIEQNHGTRVVLTHSGWERPGADGAKTRADYDTGWEFVLVQKFGEYAGRPERGPNT